MVFSWTHAATVLKYGGISFIAGAVNHGFFSESRSIWTAVIGVIFYLIGAWMDMRTQGQSDHPKTWRDVLGAGIVFSIGIGFFTGGLQHFPDSPQRSVWVVPLGFALSVWAMSVMEGAAVRAARSSVVRYGFWATLLVVAGSLLTWQLLGSVEQMHDHGAGVGHQHAPVASSQDSGQTKDGATLGTVRQVNIEMNDQMRFVPDRVQVQQGETIRFVVRNTGKVRHEWVIGTERELLEHAAQMRQSQGSGRGAAGEQHTHGHGSQAHSHQLPAKPSSTPHDSPRTQGAQGHSHDATAAISLGAGEQGTLTWTFNQAQPLLIACFEPGHYEAGMRGSIEVIPSAKR